MNVQSISCQPIRPNVGYSFGNRYDETYDYDSHYFDDMRHERDEWAEIAQNKDNKMMSAIGTLGVSAMAGALSFCTFKAVAPKGYQTLKSIINKITSNNLVKKVSGFVAENAKKLGSKIKTKYVNINPETKMGKVKAFISKYLTKFKDLTKPVYTKVADGVKGFMQKHNIDKAWAKTAVKNVGATAVAIPAAITAGNTSSVDGEEI